MSTEPRTLAGYVVELVDRLDAGDPAAGRRLRRVVAGRRARIQVGDEAVVVDFSDGQLRVMDAGTCRERVDGDGVTDRATVIDLLDARTDVTACILNGRIQVRGAWHDVADMFLAIEIVLDATPRVPALRRLAREYRDQVRPLLTAERLRGTAAGGYRWPPHAVEDTERALLSSLGLLPPGGDGGTSP